MKGKPIILLSVLLILLIINSGCMKPQINVVNPVAPNLNPSQSIMIHVVSQVEDTEEEIKLLETTIQKQLDKKDVFFRVVPNHIAPDSATDLRMNVTIVDLIKARGGNVVVAVLFSALVAKKAGIKVEVALYNTKTGENLGNFDISFYKKGETTKSVIGFVAYHITKTISDRM